MPGYRLLRPLLFSLPAETTHNLVSGVLHHIQHTPIERLLTNYYTVTDSRLSVSVLDTEFPNPIGVAAGFDKNATFPSALASLGFGHVEIGGVTAEPQAGNPRPRLFRLVEDCALINRMGFNNHGADTIASRLTQTPLPDVPLGINIGLSKTTPLDDAPDDYTYTYTQLADHGDYFVVNVSSPNTPGLRDLQYSEPLDRIITALQDAGASPLLVKLSPDLPKENITDVVSLANTRDLDGIIAVNTTVDRPNSLTSPHRDEDGGLSGKPLADHATQTIQFVADQTDLPIIGVGGVFTAADAYEKIRAGATLVQLYTGLVYRGPRIARDINHGLLDRLDRDGFTSITDAIGTA